MSYSSKLRTKYESEVRPALLEEFSITNPMAAPTCHKVVVNIGAGDAGRDPKLLDEAQDELTQITGQKPTVRLARKSIANFKLRDGMPIGVAVTLRGERMWDFLDRLMNLALPRVRDFRGVPKRAFDGRGNYTLGVKDQLIFPEIDYAKVQRSIGMNITIVTSATTDAQAMSLLARLGMPFAR